MPDLQTLYWPLFVVNLLFSADLGRQVFSGRTQWPARHGFFETVPAVPVLRTDRPLAYWFLIVLRAIPLAGLWIGWLSIRRG